MDANQQLKAASRLRSEGRLGEALAALREPLRRDALGAEDIDKAGRLLRKLLAARAEPAAGVPDTTGVLVLGQCTTAWVASALTAVAWGRGLALDVVEGEFDNVLQELEAARTRQPRPRVVVLLPWTQRLLGAGDRPAEERVRDELEFWQRAWQIVREDLGASLLQVGCDWVGPGPRGAHLSGRDGGPVQLVRAMNDAFRAALPAGAYFLDLEQVSGAMGREAFYDSRRWFWTRQPFSEAGAVRLARALHAGLRALLSGPKKVLVTDLDNTLWGGVVGETGPLGVALGESPDGEAFRAFQRHLRGLSERGCVLAVASKNNPEDAREVFRQNPAMELKLESFGAFEACWEPKSVMLRRIAETLSLGLDSFVFFDDSPVEREEIRQALPEVEVVEVPPDPADYAAALDAGLWFEAVALTREDAARAGQYRAEAQRREMQRSVGSLDDYLRSLEMTGTVAAIEEADVTRVVQLLHKTNQFNLTTRRHTEEELRRLLARPRALGLTLRLADRFGDYGLIAVLLGVPADDDPATIVIDTLLMSCRAIGRTVEHGFLGKFLDAARALGFERVRGEYQRTSKNALVAELYPSLGFTACPSGGASAFYELDLRPGGRPVTFVQFAGS